MNRDPHEAGHLLIIWQAIASRPVNTFRIMPVHITGSHKIPKATTNIENTLWLGFQETQSLCMSQCRSSVLSPITPFHRRHWSRLWIPSGQAGHLVKVHTLH